MTLETRFWYNLIRMKRILPFFILLISILISTEVKAGDYFVEEKNENYIVVGNKNFTNLEGKFLSGNTNYTYPNIVLDFFRSDKDLGQRFEIAEKHCATLDKATILVYKLIPDRNPGQSKIGKPFDFKIFDEDTTGEFSRIRFFCADDSAQAKKLYDEQIFSSKFKSQARLKYTSETTTPNWRFDIRQSEDVQRKIYERAQSIEEERKKKLELAAAEAKKIEAEKKEEVKKIEADKKRAKFAELDKVYGKKCQGGLLQKDIDKNSQKFNDCLLAEEAKTLAIQKQQTEKLALAEEKKQRAIDEKNKIAALEQSKIQTALQQKKELDQAKVREEQIKVSKMTPDDRRAYNCTEKFGFKKGSDKFKDCIFSMYKAETELEKIELQKKLIEANLEVAKAKEREAIARENAARSEQERQALAQQRNNALLERQVLAQERAAAAAAQQARISDFESSQRMIDRGLEMLSGQRNLAGQVRQPTQRFEANCHFTGRYMTCF